jgi:aconitate hydratase
MVVLPLQFKPGENADSLGLNGQEVYSIDDLSDSARPAGLQPQNELSVRAVREDGSSVTFQVIARLNTMVEVEYYRGGGVLNTVLRNML